MKTVKLALYAMATRFELVLHGDDETDLRAIGEEVFNEILALSEQLNFHCQDSEVSHINAYASLGPVTVEPGLFRLLQEAKLCLLYTSPSPRDQRGSRMPACA